MDESEKALVATIKDEGDKTSTSAIKMDKSKRTILEMESIQQLIDTVLKLSTALLLLPIVFLKFVAEVGPKAHPDALRSVYEVGWGTKCGIFLPLGLSIITGLLTKFLIIRHIRREYGDVEGTLAHPISRTIHITTFITGLLCIVGMGFLIYLFFSFPIEIPEAFRIGRSKIS